jgi:hypothetical protein
LLSGRQLSHGSTLSFFTCILQVMWHTPLCCASSDPLPRSPSPPNSALGERHVI